jgi:Caspase domain
MATWLVILFLLLGPSSSSLPAQERCSTAQDYLVAGRERCHPSASRDDVEGALRYLKSANQLCFNLGDAWYYRYLCEKRLGNQRSAENALDKAKRFGSEALVRGDDPFTLSTAPGTVPAGSGKTNASTRVREKWALVVGISKFRDSRINLTFPAKDARDFATLLTDRNYGRFKPEHVHLLTDDRATTVQIRSEFEWLRKSANEDDLVVIYFSGHGSPGEVDPEGISYVITYDTEATEDGLYATSLPMVDIVNAVQNRIKARRAAVFLDTCYSGAALKGARALVVEKRGVSNTTLERFHEGVGRVVISASQANERSWESGQLKNGYFTYYLIQGLRKNNGMTPIEQVFVYIRDEVSKRVREDLRQPQTPAMKRSEQSGEICIGVDTESKQSSAPPHR